MAERPGAPTSGSGWSWSSSAPPSPTSASAAGVIASAPSTRDPDPTLSQYPGLDHRWTGHPWAPPDSPPLTVPLPHFRAGIPTDPSAPRCLADTGGRTGQPTRRRRGRSPAPSPPSPVRRSPLPALYLSHAHTPSGAPPPSTGRSPALRRDRVHCPPSPLRRAVAGGGLHGAGDWGPGRGGQRPHVRQHPRPLPRPRRPRARALDPTDPVVRCHPLCLAPFATSLDRSSARPQGGLGVPGWLTV